MKKSSKKKLANSAKSVRFFIKEDCCGSRAKFGEIFGIKKQQTQRYLEYDAIVFNEGIYILKKKSVESINR